MRFVTTIVSAVSALALGASAAVLDVWNPPIISPAAGTVWVIGQHYNVTWDTSNPPNPMSTHYPQVLLSKGGIQFWQNPLATGFSLYDGWVTIQVPVVEPGDDYAIVLFGDSGNVGEDFSIIQ